MTKQEISVSYQFDMILLAYDIRLERQKARLTQYEVADLVEVSRSAVALWERGDATGLLIGNLLRLCNLYDLNPTDYFCLYSTGARDFGHAQRIRGATDVLDWSPGGEE